MKIKKENFVSSKEMDKYIDMFYDGVLSFPNGEERLLNMLMTAIKNNLYTGKNDLRKVYDDVRVWYNSTTGARKQYGELEETLKEDCTQAGSIQGPTTIFGDKKKKEEDDTTEKVIWDSWFDFDNEEYKADIKKNQYQDYLNDLDGEEPEDFEDWYKDYVYSDLMDLEREYLKDDLNIEILPKIEKQVEDDIIVLDDEVFSNSAVEGLENYIGDFERVRLLTKNNELYIECDGSLSGIYTIPDDETELVQELGYDEDDEDDAVNHFREDLSDGTFDVDILSEYTYCLKPITYNTNLGELKKEEDCTQAGSIQGPTTIFGSTNKKEEVREKLEEAGGTIREQLNTGTLRVLDTGLYGTGVYEEHITDDNFNETCDTLIQDIAPRYIKEIVQEVLPSAEIYATGVYHPREYNFANDELEFDLVVNADKYEALKEKAINDPAFEQYLKDTYKSYDGFISFMPDNIEEFNEAERWKQMVQVIMFALRDADLEKEQDEYEMEFLEELSVDYPTFDNAVYGIADNIRDAVERGEMTLDTQSVADYVRKSYGDIDEYDDLLDAILDNLNLTESKKVTEAQVTTAEKSVGEYWVGDPCYVLADDIYDDIWGKKYDYKDGLIDCGNGLSFDVHGTAWGDGCYEGSNGFSYGVDSGTLAVIPKALVAKKDGEQFGTYHKSTNGEIEYIDGVFHIEFDNEILDIDTDPTDDDYSDDESWSSIYESKKTESPMSREDIMACYISDINHYAYTWNTADAQKEIDAILNDLRNDKDLDDADKKLIIRVVRPTLLDKNIKLTEAKAGPLEYEGGLRLDIHSEIEEDDFDGEAGDITGEGRIWANTGDESEFLFNYDVMSDIIYFHDLETGEELYIKNPELLNNIRNLKGKYENEIAEYMEMEESKKLKTEGKSSITVTRDVNNEKEALEIVNDSSYFDVGEEVEVNDWNGRTYKVKKEELFNTNINVDVSDVLNNNNLDLGGLGALLGERKDIKLYEAKDIEYISQEEFDKIPADYKTTVGDTIKYGWGSADKLTKIYRDLGYEDTDPMIMTRGNEGTILKPVKIKECIGKTLRESADEEEIPVVNPDEKDYYNNKGFIVSLYPRSRSLVKIF